MTRISNLKISNLNVGLPNTIPVTWVSPDKVIGRFQQYESLSSTLNATNAKKYAVVRGSLPAGISLIGHLLFGAFSNSQESAIFTIRATAKDGTSYSDKEFVIVVGQYPAPIWKTPAGLLDDVNVDTPISIPLLAIDQYGLPISYTIYNGSLPNGLLLDPNTGIISGTISGFTVLAPDGKYEFSVSASNGQSNAIQSFDLYVEGLNSKNIWITPAGSIGYGYGLGQFDEFILAQDPDGAPVTYVRLAGNIPDFLVINPSTGEISGQLAEVLDDTTFRFLMGARTSSYVSRRMFEITVKFDAPPVIEYINNNDDSGLSAGAIEQNPYYSNANITINPDLNFTISAENLPDFATSFDANTGSVYFESLPIISDRRKNELYKYNLIVTDGIKTTQQEVGFTNYRDLPPVFESESDLFSEYGSDGANVAYGKTISPLAIDPYGRPIVYKLIANSYMYGMKFDSSTGKISGILPDARLGDIQINATVQATSQAMPSLSVTTGANPAIRDFTLTIWKNVVPEFVTPSGNIGNVVENFPFNSAIVAVDPHGKRQVTYRLVSSDVNGSPAPGITLNADGTLTGYSGSISDPFSHTYNFTVEASYNGFMPVTSSFAITVEKDVPPIWDTGPGLDSNLSVLAGTKSELSVFGHDPNGAAGNPIRYYSEANNLPAGIRFSENQISGFFPPVETVSTPVYYTFNQNNSPNIEKTSPHSGRISNTTIMYSAGELSSENLYSLVVIDYVDTQGINKSEIIYNLDSNSQREEGYWLPAVSPFQYVGAGSILGYITKYSVTYINKNGSLVKVGDKLAEISYINQGVIFTLYSTVEGIWTAQTGMNYPISSDENIGYVTPTNWDSGPKYLDYDFTVTLTDGINPVDRTFTVRSNRNLAPTWVTTPGVIIDLPSYDINQSNAATTLDYPLTAVDPEGNSISYFINMYGQDTIFATSREQIYISLSNGRVVGYFRPVPRDEYYYFTVKAWDNTHSTAYSRYYLTNQSFRIWNRFDQDPVWVSSPNINYNEGRQVDLQLYATNSGDWAFCTYSLENGVLPPGLSISDGHITGKIDFLPDNLQEQSYVFTLKAHNSSYNKRTVDRTFTFTVYKDIAPTWITPVSPAVGISHLAQVTFANQVIVAQNNSGPYGEALVYTLVSRGTLPPTITGAASTRNGLELFGNLPFTENAQTFDFVVSVYDGSRTTIGNFVLETKANQNPVWTTSNSSMAQFAHIYANTTAINDMLPLVGYDPEGNAVTYSLSTSSSLPGSLVLNSDGSITGLTPAVNPPASLEQYTFDATIHDGTLSTTDSFTLDIRRNVEPEWVTNSGNILTIAAGITPHNRVIATDFYNDPLTYSKTNGNLPAGIALLDNGYFSGTAPVLDNTTTYSFEATVTDGLFNEPRDFDILVRGYVPPALVPNNISHNVNAAVNTGVIVASVSQSMYFSASLYGYSPVLLELYGEGKSDINYGIVKNDVAYTFQAIGQPTIDFVHNVAYDFNAGVISGTLSVIDNTNTTYAFNFTANDGISQTTETYFVELLYERPILVPPSGTIFHSKDDFNQKIYAYSPRLYANAGVGDSQINYGITSTIIGKGAGDAANAALYNSLSYDPITGNATSTIPVIDGSSQYVFTFTAGDGIGETTGTYYIDLLYQPPIIVPNSMVLATQFEQTTFTAQVYGYSAYYQDDLTNGVTTADIYNYKIIKTDVNDILSDIDPNKELPAFIPSSTVVSSFVDSTINKIYDPEYGLLSATLPVVLEDTMLGFKFIANDGISQSTTDFYVNVIYNSPPIFNTSSTLLEAYEQTEYSVQISAYSPSTIQSPALFYSITKGQLPNTLTMSGDGAISGYTPVIVGSDDQTFIFTVTATSGTKHTDKEFSLKIKKTRPPVWDTTGALGNIVEGDAANYILAAHDPSSLPLVYTLRSGVLPPNLIFNATATSSTASLTGNAGAVLSDTPYSFVIGADNGFIRTDRTFTLTVKYNQPPVWATSNTNALVSAYSGTQISTTLVATDPENKSVQYTQNTAIYAWPSWATLSPTTGVLTGTLPAVFGNTAIYFGVNASDGVRANSRVFYVNDLFDNQYYDPLANVVNLHINFDSGVTDLVGGHAISGPVPTIDTTTKANGTGSGKFVSANGTYMYISDASLNPTVVAPITIEFMFKPATLTNTGNLFSVTQNASPATLTYVVRQVGNILNFIRHSLGNPATSFDYYMPSASTFYHVALVSQGTGGFGSSGLRVFVNGAYLSLLDSPYLYPYEVAPIYFGSGFDGWIDDIRITNAIRYPSNFTVKYAPVAPSWVSPANNAVIATAKVGVPFTAQFSVTAPDSHALSGTFQYTVTGLSNATVTSSGLMTATIPTYTTASISITVYAKDSNGNSTKTRTFTINVTP